MKEITGLIIKINNEVAEVAIPKRKKEICVLIPQELQNIIKIGNSYLFDSDGDDISFHIERG